jgi:polysaccharide pyruvyl transferase WcaK-like protein
MIGVAPGRSRAGRAPCRVGVYGGFGIGNYGNEATLAATLDLLRDAGTPTEITVICEGAERAARDHHVRATALGTPYTGRDRRSPLGVLAVTANRLRLLAEALWIVRRLDAVVVAGCGPLELLGSGAWGAPFETFALALATRLLRRRFVIANIGVEVSERRLTRFFVRTTAQLADYRSYRDENARRAMAELGVAVQHDALAPDLVLGLNLDAGASAPRDRVVVGVMAYFGVHDDRATHAELHDDYTARAVDLVGRCLDAGFEVLLVGGDDDDLPVAHAVARDVARISGVRPAVLDSGDPRALAAAMSGATAVVGVRYHTIVTALCVGTPAVSTGYGRKHVELMRTFGMEKYVHTVETFDVDQVAKQISALGVKRDQVATHLVGQLDRVRSRLSAQRSDLFAAIGLSETRSPELVTAVEKGHRA